MIKNYITKGLRVFLVLLIIPYRTMEDPTIRIGRIYEQR